MTEADDRSSDHPSRPDLPSFEGLDAAPRFARERIRFCEEFLARFADPDPLVVENMHRAIADARFQLGEAAAGDRLYRGWLDADPSWGWGWIGWSDAQHAVDSREAGLPLERLGDVQAGLAGGGGGSSYRIGRNQPCPCGSGKKYKKCCGRPAGT